MGWGSTCGKPEDPPPKAEQELSGLRDKGGPFLVNTSPAADRHQGCCPPHPHPRHPIPAQGLENAVT